MRDVTLLSFTLHAICDLGEGMARIAQPGKAFRQWHAGPQPLNAQAIGDLLADGWLRLSQDGCEIRIDAWPSFATIKPGDGRHG